MKTEEYDKAQVELKHYPKSLVLEPTVSSGIKAKRCFNCLRIYFTNNSNFKLCRKCTPNDEII